jgi:predicted RNase H-like nuclease (RuvC/YqgF family)
MGESLEDELDRLRRERDSRLHTDLSKLSQSIDHLAARVSLLAPLSEVEKLSDRINKLESYKWMIVGGFGAVASLQAVQAFLAWFLSHSK